MYIGELIYTEVANILGITFFCISPQTYYISLVLL